MILIQLYKKTPRSFRDKVNFVRHRVNSNRLLLIIFSGIRHHLTLGKLAKLESPYKLRLGESRSFEGWVSTNYQVFCKNFLDATKPFRSGRGAEFIFIDNVIEHLPLPKGKQMLINIFDALNPGGILRLATPDLRNIAETYLKPSQNYLEDFRNDFSQHGIQILYPPDLLKATFNHFGHQYGYIYDFETLKIILTSIGFNSIERFPPGKSRTFELQNIESRVGMSDQWGQLCIEAKKP